MSSIPTREEFNARIEAIELGMDLRVERLGGDLRAYMAEQRERDKRIELLAQSAAESAQAARGLKANVWGAAIAVILAIVGAYFAAQQSNIGIAQLVAQVYQQGQQSAPPPSAKPASH